MRSQAKKSFFDVRFRTGKYLARLSHWLLRAKREDEFSLFIKELIGKYPKDTTLYQKALTHKSAPQFCQYGDNERLEFLGDGILNSIVVHSLYELYPEEPEGVLSCLKAYIVSRSNMNATAERLGIHFYLRYQPTISLDKTALIGNALEAFIGAIYLDRGYDVACHFVQKHIIVSRKHLKKVSLREEDYKTEFIILMQKHKLPFLFHSAGTVSEPGGSLLHRCQLFSGSQLLGFGEGTSKKMAHQKAAKEALEKLHEHSELLSHLQGEATS